MTPPPSTAPEIPTATPPRSPRPPGLLVVDDNDAVRTFLGAATRASGFTVWLASGCLEAVALYQSHGAEIDLVLLDVLMPEYDGPAALIALRALAPTVPCCFISGSTGYYTEDYLLGLGAAAVFYKPFRLAELIEQLQRLTAPPAPACEPYQEPALVG